MFFFKVILERISVRKSDLQMLNEAASRVLEDDTNSDVTEFLKTVNERFQYLEDEVAKKRDFFGGLVERWNEFTNRRRRISEIFQGTSSLIAKRQIRSADEVKDPCGSLKNPFGSLKIPFGYCLIPLNPFGSL